MGDSHEQCFQMTASKSTVRPFAHPKLVDIRRPYQGEKPRIARDAKLASDIPLETSERIRARVEEARERQRRRFEGRHLSCNAEMGPGEVREYCPLDDGGRSLLKSAMQQLQMSARAFHRILKLAHTIADLAGEEGITTSHVAEAIQYRPRRQI